MTVGEKIENVINYYGMKKTSFAESVNISAPRLSQYINNKRRPDIELLQEITKKYNVNPAYFIDEDATMFLKNDKKENEIEIPEAFMNNTSNNDQLFFRFDTSKMNDKEKKQFEKQLNAYAKFLFEDIEEDDE